MRSRAVRAVEQLEPSDVLALRATAVARDASANVLEVPGGSPETVIALQQAGCLLVTEGIGQRTKYEVTPVGRGVLAALGAWPRVPTAPG